ncbi:MAG: efflux RND transporter periplasmic adaptor subunit, partial [Phenylobacterium sp.]|uniref:efflux RND transporter periplasmic adaptor subunit n=1 Tax=Phenylobacterium sp. TaxID=1871053 RepID=UPI002735EAC2
MEFDGLLRRHFFLAGALAILLVMVVVGGLKMATRPSGPGQAAAGAPAGKGGPGGRGGMAAQVSATTVTERTFVEAIDVLGVAKGRQSVTLSAAATQLVQKVNFTDGQSVGRGAVLVELKDSEQDAGLEQARAKLVQAQRAYDRWKALSAKGFAAKASVDQYEADYQSAVADVRAAEARRNDRMIRAPFAGVVGLSDIAPGALVNPGAVIATLDDLSAVRVDFEVPERYVASLRDGQPIVAHADAYPDQAIAGRIAKLDTRVDPNTHAITARAEFPNPGGRLRPGMLMRVAIARG